MSILLGGGGATAATATPLATPVDLVYKSLFSDVINCDNFLRMIQGFQFYGVWR